jgi:hypothetical protein
MAKPTASIHERRLDAAYDAMDWGIVGRFVSDLTVDPAETSPPASATPPAASRIARFARIA